MIRAVWFGKRQIALERVEYWELTQPVCWVGEVWEEWCIFGPFSGGLGRISRYVTRSVSPMFAR